MLGCLVSVVVMAAQPGSERYVAPSTLLQQGQQAQDAAGGGNTHARVGILTSYQKEVKTPSLLN